MERRVQSDGCMLHAESNGEGHALLLIHGVACDHHFYDGVVECLADRYQVITYDRRGHSLSKADNGAEYSAAVQAEDARRVLDAFDVQEATVAACSAGGIVALELACRYPERVKKLFLHETPLAASKEIQSVYDEWQEKWEKLAREEKIASAMMQLIKAMGGFDRTSKPVSLEQQGQNMENLKVFLYHEMNEFLHYCRSHPDLQLQVPHVISSGEMDSYGLFSKYVPEAANYLACPYLRVPGYHNLAWDMPYVFTVNLLGALDMM